MYILTMSFLILLFLNALIHQKAYSSPFISSIYNDKNENQDKQERNIDDSIDIDNNNNDSFICSSAKLRKIQHSTTTIKHENNDVNQDNDSSNENNYNYNDNKKRIQCAKYKLWQHGAFALDENMLVSSSTKNNVNDKSTNTELGIAEEMERYISLASLKLGPIRNARRRSSGNNRMNEYCAIRGGGGASSVDDNDNHNDEEDTEEKIQRLKNQFGSQFAMAIEKNIEEHKADCELSCKYYYCDDDGNNNNTSSSSSSIPTSWNSKNNGTNFASYSMGAVPPEDFSNIFRFPLDLIKVTQGKPLFTSSEAEDIIKKAEQEGVANNEYKSGKYKLGGDWLTNLPNTRQWFNTKLQTTFFPLLTSLFPEIITSSSTLRAHSVSLLKYNSSHPRTDVHIDNGILAMTISMTPLHDYKGGGTFFEHMSNGEDEDYVIHMDVGHGTFRPGSVRHGGHTVKEGTRYILGAFLLLVDKVEHVRRLKNKGSEFRKKGDLDTAEKYFMWALAINPKCTTCMKDWAEIHLTKKQYPQAETKLSQALDLLEQKDSDALFTLGIALSEQGKEEESINAYLKSLVLNAQDAELCYNLGIKFGNRGDYQKEFEMYKKAVSVDPSFGGAWINWGTGLAERGQLDEAEDKFKMALSCAPEIVPKAMFNLALVHQARANQYTSSNKLEEAKLSIQEASKLLEAVKPLLFDNENTKSKQNNEEMSQYARMYKPLRLQVYKLSGQILAALRDYASCEDEFRHATLHFPNEGGVWDMLSRILQLQGKVDEAKLVKEKADMLRNVGNMFGP